MSSKWVMFIWLTMLTLVCVVQAHQINFLGDKLMTFMEMVNDVTKQWMEGKNE